MKIGRAHACTPATPISTLFPYPTLFRSSSFSITAMSTPVRFSLTRCSQSSIFGFLRVYIGNDEDRKSTRLHSSHTDIYPLSLPDSLPIFIVFYHCNEHASEILLDQMFSVVYFRVPSRLYRKR